MSDENACSICREAIDDALARTARLTVDRSQIDSQRLCPECFAEWIERYQEEMQVHQTLDAESDIIVD